MKGKSVWAAIKPASGAIGLNTGYHTAAGNFSSGYLTVGANGSTLVFMSRHNLGVWTPNKTLQVGLILLTTGGYVFVKGDDYPDWTLAWVSRVSGVTLFTPACPITVE